MRLQRCDFSGADLKGLAFGDEGVTCKLTGAKYDAKTQFPAGFDPAEHGMVKV